MDWPGKAPTPLPGLTLTCHAGIDRSGLLCGHHVVVGHVGSGPSSCLGDLLSDRRENTPQQAVT